MIVRTVRVVNVGDRQEYVDPKVYEAIWSIGYKQGMEDAIKKQIPKKPIDDIEYPICPGCNKPLYHGCNDRYCVDCGQKLDWNK